MTQGEMLLLLNDKVKTITNSGITELQYYQSNKKQNYYYFSSKTKKWETVSFSPFIYDGVSFLLVPKQYTTKNQSSNLERLIDSYIEEPISKELKVKVNGKLKNPTKKAYKKKHISGERLKNATILYEKASSQSHKNYQNKIYQYIKIILFRRSTNEHCCLLWS
ncbi:Uncharacterised protein [Staphylococcus aureus]|uniref:hypothetical protein n=1 Tax=Staphylococcus aureus TaxID=1280 RepID=UPI000E078B5E|nr:hypothetical protein [Staphylococcus aureus]SUL88911.1 Uncharacterised protein [Staphylococcus aureus]